MSLCLYGMHPVLEAVRSGKNIDKVLLKQGLEGPQYRELAELLKEKKIPVQFVPAEKLSKISRGGAHQGVAAFVAAMDTVSLEQMTDNAFALHETPIFVILDGVSDVRNLGAIARTLECAGGCGIILPAKGGAALNADAVKTSAGALMRLDVCRVPNLRYAAYYLKQNGDAKVVINGYASPEGKKSYNEKLAQKRADKIKDILVKKYNISASRIEAKGMGVGSIYNDPSWNRVSICVIK